MSSDLSGGGLDNGFMERFQEKLNTVRKGIDEDKARQKVLWLCDQLEPKSFEEYSSSGSFRKLEKFESSTYSEVLRATNLADNKIVVMKIMRALSKMVFKKLPSEATKGCQSYCDILNEIVITQALSNLHKGVSIENSLYKTHGFCQIYEIKVVNGKLDKVLKVPHKDVKNLSAINIDYQAKEPLPVNTNGVAKNHVDNVPIVHEEKVPDNLSEDDRMLMESLPYEYVVTVMKHDGKPLWSMINSKKLTGTQLVSVLVQVIAAIAVAESVYYYEHRDLHVSNILIRPTTKTKIPFVVANSYFGIDSYGIKATIIDATFSRLSYKKRTYCRDLTSTLRLYGTKKVPAKMSLQNRCYREMVHITKNDWEVFKPKTNLIWLTYLCETLMKDELIKGDGQLNIEVRKIRDWTLKAKTTMDLLKKFPFKELKKSAGNRHSS